MIWILVMFSVAVLLYTIKSYLDYQATVNGKEMKQARRRGLQQVEEIKRRKRANYKREGVKNEQTVF